MQYSKGVVQVRISEDNHKVYVDPLTFTETRLFQVDCLYIHSTDETQSCGWNVSYPFVNFVELHLGLTKAKVNTASFPQADAAGQQKKSLGRRLSSVMRMSAKAEPVVSSPVVKRGAKFLKGYMLELATLNQAKLPKPLGDFLDVKARV